MIKLAKLLPPSPAADGTSSESKPGTDHKTERHAFSDPVLDDTWQRTVRKRP